MSQAIRLLLLAVLVTTASACSLIGKEKVTPPDPLADLEPHEVEMRFQAEPGMTRDQVEEVLGAPFRRGLTKEGNHHLMWRTVYTRSRPGTEDVTMYHHHSIEFDRNWRVVRSFR
ncbi:MAG: outer membrane protein assembly factor BamE [Candidatus Sumerlaeia bacterium]|nr:outer membrane protein assembly factor BamE [Candidatus Sumerlaeia bacterium]